MKYTYENVKDIIEKDNENVLISTEYKNSKTKLEVECNQNHTYWIRLNDFNSGVRCAECRGVKKNTLEEVKEYIEHRGSKLLSTEYINTNEPLTIECPRGHVYKQPYYIFKQRVYCPECNPSKPKTYKEVREYIESKGYGLSNSSYKNTQESSLNVVCPHKHKFKTSYNMFQSGRRCPHCLRASRGEKQVEALLKGILPKKVKWSTQERVDIEGNVRIFDFFIDVGNGIYIEYDGEQHYRPISSWGGEDYYNKIKERDREKDNYVKERKGSLLRIPYTDRYDNISRKLKSFLTGQEIKVHAIEKLPEVDSQEELAFKVANYYLQNTRDQTISEYGVSRNTVGNYFLYVYGKTKTEYLRK